MSVNVSEDAVFSRLKGAMLRDGQRLMRCRVNSQWFRDLGRYYSVNFNNHITGTNLDLEREAREAGVLLPTETVAS